MKKVIYVFVIVILIFSSGCVGGGDSGNSSSVGLVENYSFSDAQNYVNQSGFVVIESKKVENSISNRYEYYFIVRLAGQYCLQVFKSDENSPRMDDQYCGTYNYVKGLLP